MTTLAEARNAVEQRWLDNWTLTPFVFENEANDTLYSGKVAWTRVVYRNTAGGQETLGRPTNRKYKRDASVMLSFFTPADMGLTESATLAQAGLALYEGVTFDGLFFNDGVVQEIGPDGRWYQTNVEVFSDYQEIK